MPHYAIIALIASSALALEAVNGIFGVLASALAVFVAFYRDVRTKPFVGAARDLDLSSPLALLSTHRADLVDSTGEPVEDLAAT